MLEVFDPAGGLEGLNYIEPSPCWQQFNDVKSLERYKGQIDYVDLCPPNWEEGESQPIMVIGGWSIGLRSMYSLGQVLYEANQRTIIVDLTKLGRIPKKHKSLNSHDLLVDHKTHALVTILAEAGIERVDVLAHSMGALDAALTAACYPEMFDKLVLAMPAGMIGEDSIHDLAKRFMQETSRGFSRDLYRSPLTSIFLGHSGLHYVTSHPERARREAQAMAEITIDDLLAHLRDKGVKIGILQAHCDRVFPDDRIEQHIRLEDKPGHKCNADAYASLSKATSGHNELLIRPEKVALAALRLFDNLGTSATERPGVN